MAVISQQSMDTSLRVIATPKRVRARLGPTLVADSRDAKIVSVHHPRTYAFPAADVRMDLASGSRTEEDGTLGRLERLDLRVGSRVAEGALVRYLEGPAAHAGLEGHVGIEWDAVDAWYEEAEEVVIHPRDPFHRIDALQSDRHVVVEHEGERLAESRRPVLLFETGLPVRYYLPPLDVLWDALEPSETTTRCPYKGTADYHHIRVADTRIDDAVWRYQAPLPDAAPVRGLLCFFQERVDVVVDGAEPEHPQTPWT